MATTKKPNETKKCIHCNRNINIKYRTCPVCGGYNREKVRSLPPVCPRCEKPLKTHTSKKERFEICSKCGGMWLDRQKFHLATRTYDVYKKGNYEAEYMRSPGKNPDGYIPCVRCGMLMNRRNFGRISGVMIDRCGRHGVWLDAGELEKIRHFIADGGLERSRDREIQKNRGKIEDLATTVKEVAFTQRLIHFWNPKRWLFRGG